MLSLHGLILLGLLATSIDGGDVTHWATTTCWSTAWATPEKESVTYWSTSTFWATEWSTAPPETIYNTLWSTYVQPTTLTETITEFVYSTENNYYTNTETLNNYLTNTATKTINNYVTNTATETGTVTITSASVLVTTLYSTITEACTTASLTGLVLCPYRDVNPTYTPPGPLPTDYLRGCPPDTLCTPKQYNCNFERDSPADTYFCSPEDCVSTPPLPPVDLTEVNHTCIPYIPAPGYPNFNPIPFGLDYNIFEFNGQPGPSCPPPPPPPPPPPSTWVDWSSAPPPSVPASSWADWSPSPVSPPPPPASTWAEWSPPAASPAPSASSSSWQEWEGKSSGYPQTWNGGAKASTYFGAPPPEITARAELDERTYLERRDDLSIPPLCWNPCNGAGYIASNCGLKYNTLCTPGASFQVAFTSCGNCILSHKASAVNSPVERLISSLNTFVKYCNAGSPTPPAPVSVTSTSSLSSSTVPTTSTTPSSSTTTTSTPTITSSTSSATSPSPPTSSSVAPLTTPTSSSPVTVSTTTFSSSSPASFTPSPSPFTGQAVSSNNINMATMAFTIALSLLLSCI